MLIMIIGDECHGGKTSIQGSGNKFTHCKFIHYTCFMILKCSFKIIFGMRKKCSTCTKQVLSVRIGYLFISHVTRIEYWSFDKTTIVCNDSNYLAQEGLADVM